MAILQSHFHESFNESALRNVHVVICGIKRQVHGINPHGDCSIAKDINTYCADVEIMRKACKFSVRPVWRFPRVESGESDDFAAISL